jgi:hypothetical protein
MKDITLTVETAAMSEAAKVEALLASLSLDDPEVAQAAAALRRGESARFMAIYIRQMYLFQSDGTTVSRFAVEGLPLVRAHVMKLNAEQFPAWTYEILDSCLLGALEAT